MRYPPSVRPPVCLFVCLSRARRELNKKLSNRKQIARQLRTQYVDGIYSNSVTLNRLEVTQGH